MNRNMLNSATKALHRVRCRSCFHLTALDSRSCEQCGTPMASDEPRSLLARIKRSLGIEISSEIIALSIDEPERFFTNQDIETLLRLENLVILDLEDVPNWDLMFYNSKRIGRPVR